MGYELELEEDVELKLDDLIREELKNKNKD
jgi:hypothetical protein